MVARLVGKLVRDGEGIDSAKISIGERIKTESSEKGQLLVAILIIVRLQNIDGREDAACGSARLVLERPCDTCCVTALVVKQSGVQFGSNRTEILLLIIGNVLYVELNSF